ncbi:hypothetical protein BU15DRAFT_70928 [Melanogaster broomeanus]|nr:hypothetical protein BU15DRAFT_70928 [Melanogaster broomeanus]
MASNSTSHTADPYQHRVLVRIACKIPCKCQEVVVQGVMQAPNSVSVKASSERASIDEYQPGQPQELDAHNAMYKLGVLGMVLVQISQPSILQRSCHHLILSKTVNGDPSTTFYKTGDEVFLIKDFAYPYQDKTKVVKRKSLVQIMSHAMSQSGSATPRDTEHCYYTIAPQTREYHRKVVAKADRYYQRGVFDLL